MAPPRTALPLGLALLVLLAGCAGGGDSGLSKAPKTVQVTSAAFGAGQAIPRVHACARDGGQDLSPPLTIAQAPSDAKSFALIMDDPDAPGGTFTHWTVWNLPTSRTTLPQGADVGALGAREGATDFGSPGYGGPCPPSGTHRYFFKVYAADAVLDLASGASRGDLEGALSGHVLAWGELTGTYARP